jgi:hypothetical protein
LRTAFGISAGPVPDRFLIGVAVLGLLSKGGGQQPLACLVDDAQWPDHASAQVLGFVARRLAADSTLAIIAGRLPTSHRVYRLPRPAAADSHPGRAMPTAA